MCEDEATISKDLLGKHKWIEEYQISKVSFVDGIIDYTYGNATRNHLSLNSGNMYILEQGTVQNIYNKVNGLTVNSFEGRTLIDPAIDLGDKIIIDNKPIIYQGEMTYSKRFIADISSLIQIKAKEDTSIIETSQQEINRKLRAEVNRLDGSITLLTSEKVGIDEIIAMINLAIVNGQGVINISGNQVTIDSDNFELDRYGNVLIKGGKIQIDGFENDNEIAVHVTRYVVPSMGQGEQYGAEVGSDEFEIFKEHYSQGQLDNRQSTKITASGITTPQVIQTSLENEKKNFEKFQNALDVIKDIDVYKYNLKHETNDTKKHIGFVIGDNFRYSQEVTSSENKGVDTYSFVSLCCQAIKEQQEQIKRLQTELIELKGGNR